MAQKNKKKKRYTTQRYMQKYVQVRIGIFRVINSFSKGRFKKRHVLESFEVHTGTY